MSSRVEKVTELLGSEICSGVLGEGTAVTAADVQARTGTSRSAVREGLGILVSLGLLRVRRRIGYEVCRSADWMLLAPEVVRWRLAGPDARHALAELLALRALIEPAGAAAAARSASASERESIAATAGRVWATAASGDREGFIAADVELHRRVLSASGNGLFDSLGDLLAESLPPRAPDAASISLAEARAHLDLADAIVQADADRAEELSRRIVDHVT